MRLSATSRREEKIKTLKDEIKRLREIDRERCEAPDQQLSETDPDARSMATSGRGSGMVGYNVQIAVEPKHHLIVAEEVTNVGLDRRQLATMAKKAREAMGTEALISETDQTAISRTTSSLFRNGSLECRVCTRDTRRVDPSPPRLVQGDNLTRPGFALRWQPRPLMA